MDMGSTGVIFSGGEIVPLSVLRAGTTIQGIHGRGSNTGTYSYELGMLGHYIVVGH